MTQPLILPNNRHYIAIAILSLSMIIVQILISRITSVMFYYHCAFVGITFAMLGLAAGALKVHSKPSRFSNTTVDRECATHSFYAAILICLGTLTLVDLSGRLFFLEKPPQSELLHALSMLAILVGVLSYILAFVSLGVCITLLLTYFPTHTNRLYATDLVGAAIGCALLLLLLKFLDPISIMLMLASTLAILAYRLSHVSAHVYQRTIHLCSILCCLLFVVQSLSYISGQPVFRVQMAKFRTMDNFLFERWNSFSHVAILRSLEKQPFGWGLGDKLEKGEYTDVKQYWLKIDGAAGTVLTGFDGDFRSVEYLKHDVINIGYHLRDVDHTAIIGIGGGRDILSALTFGINNITGIEINPAIFEALNVKFADFTGHLASYPGVKLVNAEARSFIGSSTATYDMIQISLIDTWAATAAGGLTLSENKLYTKEAWGEFLDRLGDDGMLTVSRWFIENKHNGALYRLLSLASDSLKTMDPNINPNRHVIAVGGDNKIVTVIVSKSPFTAEEIHKLVAICAQYGFKPIITPQQRFNSVTDMILSGNASTNYYDSLPLDVTSPTDDRPFFFNMTRMTDALWKQYHGITNMNVGNKNEIAVYILSALAIIVFVYLAYAVIWPMRRLYREQRELFVNSKPFIIYFSCIGLGFMFIEMSLMQWLMIFLGHPVYALSVILFTLLFFSGLGSLLVNYNKLSHRTFIIRPLILCILLTITLWYAPNFKEVFIASEISVRVFLSVLLLTPVSLFLGMMFPLGVAAAKLQHAKLLPWFWALNGAASVFASIFSVVISMNYGASTTYKVGILCYIVCLLVFIHLVKRKTTV